MGYLGFNTWDKNKKHAAEGLKKKFWEHTTCYARSIFSKNPLQPHPFFTQTSFPPNGGLHRERSVLTLSGTSLKDVYEMKFSWHGLSCLHPTYTRNVGGCPNKRSQAPSAQAGAAWDAQATAASTVVGLHQPTLRCMASNIYHEIGQFFVWMPNWTNKNKTVVQETVVRRAKLQVRIHQLDHWAIAAICRWPVSPCDSGYTKCGTSKPFFRYIVWVHTLS